jgi:MFS transporter, AAHS family, 4-hydroxybenzoate transporter
MAQEWNGLQLRTLMFCFLLNMLDGADVLVVSFVAPLLTKAWSISDAAFGLVFSSGLAGMTLGALLLAPFADVWGRKSMILIASAVIASGMMLSALANDVIQLLILRFWTGLGIGAMLASVTSMASEFAPEKYRSLAVTTATAGYPAGAVIAGIAARWIIPEYGWQGIFLVVGACSAILLAVLWIALPESVEFLLSRRTKSALDKANSHLVAQGQPAIRDLPRGGTAATRRPAVGRLFDQRLRLATFYVWGAFFTSFLTLYFLTSWIPRIAVAAGYPLTTAINGSTIFNVGAFFGLILLGWIASRFSLAKLIVIFFFISAVALVAFGFRQTPALTFYSCLLVIGFLLQGGFGGLYAVAARIYPTEIKTTGVGWALGIGRLGAVAGPAVGGLMLSAKLDMSMIFMIFAAPMLISAVMVLLVAPFVRSDDAISVGH